MIRDFLERLGMYVPSRGGSDVPARIMVPRVVFLVTSMVLLIFGLLMIYSSSSIVGLTSKMYGYDPAYFLIRQTEFAAAGVVFALVLACMDYHMWRGSMIRVVCVVTAVLLVVVYTPLAGLDAYGATRWIAIGPFTLQPSEFAKVTIVLVGARIAEKYFWEGSIDTNEAAKLAAVGIGVPLLLVVMQPDKGTTGVALLTLLVMSYLAGVSGRHIALLCVGVLAAGIAYALKDEYSRARILTMFNPFSDPYGAGYQLTQGFYAFGSGGITGLGLGMSRQKYSYLPMAHNDFIFAVVGEELGLVGTAGMLVAFVVLLWAGFKIAESAPDMAGKLIAAGCTSLIIIQLLLNVSGVLGVFPLTGKPVPFISYGGSSIISTLMLVGLVESVSLRSALPETSYEVRRKRMRIAGEEQDGRDGFGRDGFGRERGGGRRGDLGGRPGRRRGLGREVGRGIGPDHGLGGVRGSGADYGSDYGRGFGAGRVASPPRLANLRMMEGGAPKDSRRETSRGSYTRLDLGPSPADRLRK